jgi:hypothetical protein
MKKNHRAAWAGAALALPFILGALLSGAGCATAVQRSGEFLDGSLFEERVLAEYRSGYPAASDGELGKIQVRRIQRRTGEEFIAITAEAHPTLRFIGTVPDAGGNFYLSALEFLSPNLTGWNEFTQELSGNGRFQVRDTEAVLRLPEPPEILDIVDGKIRRNITRIVGDQALTALRNRQERVRALAEWMREQEAPGGFSGQEAGQEAFEKRWYAVLFPELAPANQRPPRWNETEAAWVRGEDVRWNTAYTEEAFPEELWPVRNSGTLLRDWEEAAAWIYFQYEWDRIMESLGREIRLKKTK